MYNYSSLSQSYPAVKFRAGVVLICQGRVLVVREKYRQTAGETQPGKITRRGLYGFPKGVRADHEFDPLATAVRELREETSIDINAAAVSSRPIICWNESRRDICVFYVVKIPVIPPIVCDPGEIKSCEWVPVSKLSKIRTMNQVSAAAADCAMTYFCSDLNYLECASIRDVQKDKITISDDSRERQ